MQVRVCTVHQRCVRCWLACGRQQGCRAAGQQGRARRPSPPRRRPAPAAELLQVKALVALALLCRTPAGLVCVVSWQGLLAQMERLCSRERLQGGGPPSGAVGSEQYLAAAVAGLMQQLAGNAVPLLRQASAAARGGRGSSGRGCPPGGSAGSSSSGALQPMEALLQLLASPAFRSVVISDGLITGLADLLTRETGGSGTAASSDPVHHDLKVCRCRTVAPEFCTAAAALHPPAPALTPHSPGSPVCQVSAINAIDALCSHPELLMEHHGAVLTHLVPALSAAGRGGPGVWVGCWRAGGGRGWQPRFYGRDGCCTASPPPRLHLHLRPCSGQPAGEP